MRSRAALAGCLIAGRMALGCGDDAEAEPMAEAAGVAVDDAGGDASGAAAAQADTAIAAPLPAESHAQFCDAYEDAVVAFYVRCGLVDATNAESLRSALGAECDHRTELVAAGARLLDPAASQCLSGLAVADCASSVPGREMPPAPPLCGSLGTMAQSPVGLGETCSGSRSCGVGLVCEPVSSNLTCPKCIAPGEPGESCPCNPSTAVCASVDGGVSCVRGGAAGATCTAAFASAEPCLTGNFCEGDGVTGTCAPRIAEGASCGACFGIGFADCCEDGLRCRETGAAMAFCMRDHDAGEGCHTLHPCAAGLYCGASAVCKLKEDRGAACVNHSDCANNACLEGLCGGPLAPVGAPCTVVPNYRAMVSSTPCVPGAFCALTNPFAPTPQFAQSGECRALIAADGSCKSEGQPRDGCAGGTCRDSICTSALGGAGERCWDDDSCEPSLYCSAAKTCEVRKPAGAPCDDDACGGILPRCGPLFECETGLSCDVGTCKLVPASGDPCSASGPPCPVGLACASLGSKMSPVCAPVAARGQPCGPSNGFACAPRSRCVAGVCVPGLPGGSLAEHPRDCLSMAAFSDDGASTCVADCE